MGDMVAKESELEREKHEEDSVALLVSKMAGTHHQGVPAASGGWRRWDNRLSLRASVRNAASTHRDLNTVRLISDFWPRKNYKRIYLCCFKPLSVWWFVTIVIGNKCCSPYIYVFIWHLLPGDIGVEEKLVHVLIVSWSPPGPGLDPCRPGPEQRLLLSVPSETVWRLPCTPQGQIVLAPGTGTCPALGQACKVFIPICGADHVPVPPSILPSPIWPFSACHLPWRIAMCSDCHLRRGSYGSSLNKL